MWGTHCKFATPPPISYEDVQQEQDDLGWAFEEDVDEVEAAQAVEDSLGVLEEEAGKRAGTRKPGNTSHFCFDSLCLARNTLSSFDQAPKQAAGAALAAAVAAAV